jgi:hypothetical protein
MTTAELERARRDLRVSLALAMTGSPVAVPIRSRMDAIDAELARREPDGLTGCPRTDSDTLTAAPVLPFSTRPCGG